jgi:hypothetical protein
LLAGYREVRGPRVRAWLLVVGACGLPGCAATPALEGPLRTRNQHPAQLTVLHLDPTGSGTVAPGAVRAHWGTSYTSLWLGGTGGGNRFIMDGEILRSGLELRTGLGPGVEVGIELVAGYATGGGLDDFVIDWHSFWGLPDQGRSRGPRDGFEVEASEAGRLVFAMEEDHFGPMDLPIALKWEVVPPRGLVPGLAARAAVELPTGDDDRGFGNGEVDVACGLVGEWRLSHLGVTAQVQHAWAGSPAPARAAGFEFGDVTSAALGAELALLDGLTLLAHAEWETSTLRDLGFDRVEDDQWLLWSGLRVALGARTRLELALGEDLSSYIAPDFTIHAALSTTFGRQAEP